ncbi:hypothetical protein L596_005078 [Steinernema carpocapsae]|uniref:Uncharacterized protein n=1 Tax=Steinernema carpocapsae TaxID=34508 RepID=A0A4U8UZF3_STECR|nr:hypothetical protein L596_005078 [Steinernema carpocapsae]
MSTPYRFFLVFVDARNPLLTVLSAEKHEGWCLRSFFALDKQARIVHKPRGTPAGIAEAAHVVAVRNSVQHHLEHS